MSDVEKLEPGQCWSYLWWGGGGEGGGYRFTEPTRIGQRNPGPAVVAATLLSIPYHLHSMETRTISSSYSACNLLIYRSYFLSTFAFHGDKNYFLLHTVLAFLYYKGAIPPVHGFH
jgi:hypothetical protein